MIIDTAKNILKILNDNGYEAYIVGGYVRDYLLNIPTSDIDITTSAKVEELKELFDIEDNGISYDSIIIKMDGYRFETTTFRRDISYTDHRHPVVEYTSDVYEDLKRRDYTMNALLMDKDLNIIDKYNGIDDINNKIIKMIGNPDIRFEEDAIRILRGLYLSSRYDFNISSDVYNSMKNKSKLLDYISNGRKRIEIDKIIKNNKSNKALKYMIDTNIVKYLSSFEKGINYFVINDIIVNDLDLFYGTCFYLNGSQDKSYEFSKSYNKLLSSVIKLIDYEYDDVRMLGYDFDVYNLVNKIKNVLNKDYMSDIKEYYDNMPIHNINDIKISRIKLIDIVKTDKINNILEDIASKILTGKLINDEDNIIDYLEKRNA